MKIKSTPLLANKSSNSMRMSKLALCLAPALYTSTLLALPAGQTVVQGSAAFDQAGAQLNITNSHGTIINWQDFSIGNNEIVRFIQDSSASSVLNRVTSSIPSQIQGQLNSNGRVFVINPNGILIGQGAQIDVAGFVASTLNITDEDFASGKYNFKNNGVAGTVENRGFITTAKGGEVILIAPDVTNSGAIESKDGQILLAAGQEVSLQSLGNADIAFRISAPGDTALNLGQLLAQNGSVKVFADSVAQRGTISATRAVQGADGSITLEADSSMTVSGNIDVGGFFGVDGGSIEILGDEIVISSANINASGESGGTILIGGDYQGAGSVKNADNTTIDSSTTITADAGQNGNGGRIIVWSDGTTSTDALISAQGGTVRGDGGFVETSGKRTLLFSQPVNVSARDGEAGTWLLDPEDINIGPSEAASISSSLNGGSNVEVKTSDEGTGQGNITVSSDITKTEGDAGVSLTLDAHNRVDVNANISSTAGPLSVNIKTGRQVVGVDASSNTGGAVGATPSTPELVEPEVPAAADVPDVVAESVPAISETPEIGNGDTEVASFVDQDVNQIVITENITTAGGSVSIQAGESGDAIISSTVSTSPNADAGNQQAGNITVEANRIALTDDAKLDASGEQAGTILVGGDKKGQNEEVQNAEFTYVSENAEIKADGATNGNGGKVIVFAKDTAIVQGTITAKGGSESGDGGFIETSGLKGLQVDKAPDASAINGQAGEWLIDPYNITIGFSVNNAISGSSPFTPSATGANLNITTLLTALNLGNVTIDTAGAGIEDGDITLNGDLDFAGATASHDLIFDADGDIFINGSIYNSNSLPANKLDDLTLNADRNNDGVGDVVFNDNGFNQLQIDISGDLTIGSNTQDVKFENAYGGMITADNIDIGTGSSTSSRIDGEVIFKPGTDGFDLTVQSNTFDIFANGDVEVDASGTGNKVEISTTNSQRIYADDVIINSGGSGETGFILSSAVGSQMFDTGGDMNLDVSTGNQNAVATSAGTQNLNIRGHLRLKSNANAISKVASGGAQTIATGVSNPGLTSIVLEGTTATFESLVSSAGTQSINTNGGVLTLNKGKIQSVGVGNATVGDFNFQNGSSIDLSGGALTVNGGPVGSSWAVTGTNTITDTTVNVNANTGGDVTVSGSGSVTLSGSSTINNSDVIDVQGAGFALNGSTSLNNQSVGTVKFSGASSIVGTGSFNNLGTIEVNNTSTVSSTLNQQNILNVNSGTFDARNFSQSTGTTKVASGATLTNSVGNLTFNGGVVEGGGTLGAMGSVNATNTTFRPGSSVGQLNVSTNFDLSGGGNTFEIEADSASSFDQVNVSGILTMPTSNNVNVTFTGGYTGPINIGDMETLTGIITAGSTSSVNPTVSPGGDAGLNITNTAGPSSMSLDITYDRIAEIPEEGTGSVEAIIEEEVTGPSPVVDDGLPLLFIVIELSENERDQVVLEEVDENQVVVGDDDNDEKKDKSKNMCIVA